MLHLEGCNTAWLFFHLESIITKLERILCTSITPVSTNSLILLRRFTCVKPTERYNIELCVGYVAPTERYSKQVYVAPAERYNDCAVRRFTSHLPNGTVSRFTSHLPNDTISSALCKLVCCVKRKNNGQ